MSRGAVSRCLRGGAPLRWCGARSVQEALDSARGKRAWPGCPPTPKSDQAIDLTGTWTAVITEDWPLRMVTPKKG